MRRALLFGALFVSAAWNSAPQMVRDVRRAIAIAGLDYESRRERVLGEFYTSIRRIQREVPRDESVAIVLRALRDIDRAVFVTYYLYPRAGRLYLDALQFRSACRGEKHIVAVDLAHPAVARHLSYDALRAEELRATPFDPPKASGNPRREFIVPLIAASAGADAAAYYATNAVFAGETGTTIRMTLEPDHRERTFVLGAEQLSLRNVLYEVFGRTGTGWLRVAASARVQAAFELVNIPRHQSAGLPLLDSTPVVPAQLEGCGKLWLVNTRDGTNSIRVNEHDIVLAPRAIRILPGTPTDMLAGDGVIAFKSRLLADGNTEFVWPAGIR